MQCVVANCTSTLGVAFPTDYRKRYMWKNALNIEEVAIGNKSIVCLNHFSAEDILVVYDSDGKATKMIKKGSIPASIDSVDKKVNFDELGAVCRICLTSENLVAEVGNYLKENISVAIAMKLCCSINVQPNDGLPQHVCGSCIDELRVAHRLRVRCLETNAKFEMGNMAAIKRKRDQRNEETRAYRTDGADRTNDIDIEESHNDVVCATKVIRSRKRIKTEKGVLPKKDTQLTVTDVLTALNTEATRPTKAMSVPSQGRSISAKSDAVVIYYASEGVKECSVKTSIQGFFFIEAEDYLYSFGLIRNNVRILHCINNKCRATADHKKIDEDSYEDEINVLEPHNHKAMSKMEQKIAIFYFIVKKKLQLDKSLNIRNLYEHFCEEDSDIRRILPIRTVFNELCRTDLSIRVPIINTFSQLYGCIESDGLARLQFTHAGKQFYQERLATADDTAHAILFSNTDLLEKLSKARLMYVDASFRMDCREEAECHLVTALIWVDDSYYPILFAIVDHKTPELLRLIFTFLRDHLAPALRPTEIVTGYEASMYFALGETYAQAHIGGCVFYYVQTIYQCLCVHGLNALLETNAHFRNIYHMLLMLPLLPVNTIQDALLNMELQAQEQGIHEICKPLFEYVGEQWIKMVTPELFCVHGLDTRINENIIAPFKKLRDLLLWCKGINKSAKQSLNIVQIVEKLIELEGFLIDAYSRNDRKSFGRDLSISQKKNVLKAWAYIETHPTININNFFAKISGYIKCMENQLWIWGFYRYKGNMEEELISAQNFIISNPDDIPQGEEYVSNITQGEYIVQDDPLENANEDGTMEVEYEQQDEVVTYYEDDSAQSDGVETEVVIPEGTTIIQATTNHPNAPTTTNTTISTTDMPLLGVTEEEVVVISTDVTSASDAAAAAPVLVMEAIVGDDGQVQLHDKTGAAAAASAQVVAGEGGEAAAAEWQYY